MKQASHDVIFEATNLNLLWLCQADSQGQVLTPLLDSIDLLHALSAVGISCQPVQRFSRDCYDLPLLQGGHSTPHIVRGCCDGVCIRPWAGDRI